MALETAGNWYWIVDEIEQAQMQPKLVHAHKAKLMLGSINKTDKLDARGLNKLQRTGTLPTETRYTLRCLLRQLDMVEGQIRRIEKRMKKVFSKTEQVNRLMTLPGTGFILAVAIADKTGDISRFATPQRLASYAGTVPRVHSSGGHTRYDKL